jgi:DNA-binding CsgD family transcriptional regulator
VAETDDAIRQRLVMSDALAQRLSHLPLRPPLRLTPGERQVITLIAQGKTDAQIAKARGTSVRTVLNQVTSVFRKLGIKTREELLALLGAAPK